jgi:hypothetical protein
VELDFLVILGLVGKSLLPIVKIAIISPAKNVIVAKMWAELNSFSLLRVRDRGLRGFVLVYYHFCL